MDDIFSTAAPELQPYVADMSRQFDASREIQDRAAARYGLPGAADADQQWALERARTGVDRITRARRSRDAVSQAAAAGRLPASGGAGGGGRGGAGGLGDPSYALGGRKPALDPYGGLAATSRRVAPGVQTRTGSGGTSFAGIMQLLGPLLGSENMAALNRQGVLGLLRDGYRDPTMSGGGRSAASRLGTSDATGAYRGWQEDNSFETEDGNTAVIGEDGVMRILSPQGVLVEEYQRGAWNYDADGNVEYGNTDTAGANDWDLSYQETPPYIPPPVDDVPEVTYEGNPAPEDISAFFG